MSAGGPDLPLTVDLQEGFSGDEVTIRVGGAEVFRRPDVRTRMQTGRADGWSGPVRPGFVRLEVDVAERPPAISLDPLAEVDPRRRDDS